MVPLDRVMATSYLDVSLRSIVARWYRIGVGDGSCRSPFTRRKSSTFDDFNGSLHTL